MFDFEESVNKHFSEKHEDTRNKYIKELKKTTTILNSERRGREMVHRVFNGLTDNKTNKEKLRRILWEYYETLKKINKTESQFFRKGAESALEIPQLGVSLLKNKKGRRVLITH